MPFKNSPEIYLVTFVLFALAGPAGLSAQTPPTLHAEARVVQIEVIATDAHGKPVTDLTKADFTVTDHGKARVIDIFAVDHMRGGADQEVLPAPTAPTNPPLLPGVFSNRNAGPPEPAEPATHSSVIVLDQVNAFLEDAAYARNQAISLMQKLPADERVALYVIVRKEGLALLQDYTTDRALLTRSLTNYAPRGLLPSPPPPPTTALRDGQTGSGTAAAVAAFSAGGEQVWPPGLPPGRLGPDEKLQMWYENSRSARLSLQAFAEQLALVPGRKSVYWVTQAFPSWVMKEKRMGSPPPMEKPAWDKTITALNEANVAVNTVDSRGNFLGGNPNEGTLDSMQEIAGRTGGKAYFRRNDLDAAMEEGIEASRTTYTLAFYLNAAERDDQFHTLKVQVNRPGVELFYRQGYYAGDTDMPGASKDKANGGDLKSAFLNQADSSDVGITARIESVVPGNPRGTMILRLNLDPATLSFREQAGARVGSIEELVLERDANGATLGKVGEKKEFEVSGTNGGEVNGSVVAWPVTVPLAEGAAKLTIVVRDTQSGRVGSLTVPLK